MSNNCPCDKLKYLAAKVVLSLMLVVLWLAVCSVVEPVEKLGLLVAAEETAQTSLRKAISMPAPGTLPSSEKILKDKWIAFRLAQAVWLDKAAQADPRIIEAICAHPQAAKILAQHRHLDKIAEADHYLCRRLTRWQASTKKLIRNKYCDKVIALDPEGIYVAIERSPKVARLLGKHLMFNQMIIDNPELGKVMAKHMW